MMTLMQMKLPVCWFQGTNVLRASWGNCCCVSQYVNMTDKRIHDPAANGVAVGGWIEALMDQSR